ncbi:MAG: DM13 domain-containing protein [Pseudomonadota bacterium]
MITSMKTSIAALLTLLVIATLAAITPTQAEDAIRVVEQPTGAVVYTASFTGAGGHVTTGAVTIETKGGKTIVTLGEDFSLDGAPDPKLAFGKNGYAKDTIFTKLKNHKGAQVYEVPGTINVADYNELWLWCEKFNVPLGLAKLTKSS